MVQSKKSFKTLAIIFLIIGLMVPFIARSCVNNQSNYSNYSMEAKEYTMNIEIDENGDMHVKEKIVIDNYTDMYNNYFYKEIAYNKNNMFGNSSINKSSLRKDARVIVEDYSGVVYDTASSLKKYPNHFVGFSYNGDRDERGDLIRCEGKTQCDMIFYYNKPGMATITTFNYEYTIEGVITQYNDISEFNWVLLDYQPFKFSDITINITLPEGHYDIADEKTFFHGTNMAKREFVDNNKIVITADDMVSDEQIEVRLLLNNELFTGVDLKNKVNIDAKDEILAFEKDQVKGADFKFFIGNTAPIIIYILIILIFAYLVYVCYKKYDKEYKSEFYNEYYRELPADYSPAVMGYLYKFREIDDDDLTATLLDLIRRKYLILDSKGSSGFNDKNPDYTISINNEKNQMELTDSERYLIKWFVKEIGDGEKVSSLQLNSCCDTYSGAQLYQESSRRWYNMVKAEAKKYKFFENDIEKNKSKFIVGSVILAFLSALVFILLVSYSGYNYATILTFGPFIFMAGFIFYLNSIDKRSKKGNEDYVRWKAFKKFLEDFSSFEDYPVPSIIIWEHYLVYATSFGIADKVTEQLKLKFKLEEIYTADCTYIVYFGFGHRIDRFNRSIRNMRSSANTAIARHNAAQRTSSSFGGRSGGGGFSGGSSFGGGGGSFGGGRR